MSTIDELAARARADVDAGIVPACSISVARDGKVLLDETFGAPDDRLFVMWSCTKGITAGAVWLLMGDGLLDVERTVASYIPEFGANGKEMVTVDQLLQHTAGLPLANMGPRRWGTSEGRRRGFASWPLAYEPGTRYEYHAIGAYWVFAELIEVLTGTEFRTYIRRRILEPLGLGLRMGLPPEEHELVVPPVVIGPGSPVDAYLVESAKPAIEAGLPAGGAVARARDLAVYYQALLANTLWDGDVLADGTGVVRNTLPDSGRRNIPANRSRGMVIHGDDELRFLRHHMGTEASPRAFGHDGAGGQIAWADPETGISFAYLMSSLDTDGPRGLQRGIDLANLAATLDDRV